MLKHLTIKNYALIDELEVDFHAGFNTLTGETGAGKSILLGGLALVLGKRADLGQIKDRTKKCIVEALLDVKGYDLQEVFSTYDLDYDPELILRRELLSSGKSRAFINDTPVNLDVLNKVSSLLIDVHSQNQTLQLTSNDYLYSIIDAVADTKEVLNAYGQNWRAYKNITKEIEALQQKQNEANKIKDYNTFLLNELNEIKIDLVAYEELEEQQVQLENMEVIQQNLQFSHSTLSESEFGIIEGLKELKRKMDAISDYGDVFLQFQKRLLSVILEVEDLANEIYIEQDNLSSDPQRLNGINETLQVIHDLKLKHNVQSFEELLDIRLQLNEQLEDTINLGDRIQACKKEQLRLEKQLKEEAHILITKRQLAAPGLKQKLETILRQLGMPNALIHIDIDEVSNLKPNGKDELSLKFTANKGVDFKELRQAASGGELSRIMLGLKSIMADHKKLPTLIFDEIDTGVSGDIADKMGEIMKKMSRNFQLLSITHLPQIAAKGDQQYKVFKEDTNHETLTKIKALNREERIEEIAKMLGGQKLSNSALAHAQQLLN